MENLHFNCSPSTIYRYKPFYIGTPAEREKVSCLSIKCQNAHLLLKGSSNFRTTKKLLKLDSLTELLKLKDSVSGEHLEKKHPEFASPKLLSYYLFEKKTETMSKMARRKAMSGLHVLARVINWIIVQQLVNSGDSYLRHQKHVYNIATVLTKIKERHQGKYIEMEFSENIALKTEWVSRGPFFGKAIRFAFYHYAPWRSWVYL